MHANQSWKHVATFASVEEARKWAQEKAAAGLTVKIEPGVSKQKRQPDGSWLDMPQWIGCFKRRRGQVRRIFQGDCVGARVSFPKAARPTLGHGQIIDKC